MLLHLIDLTDSKMAAMQAQLEREKDSASLWTSYNAALERSLLDREKYLQQPDPQPRPAAPAQKSSPFAQALLSALDGGKGK
jgi:hypothetical protein